MNEGLFFNGSEHKSKFIKQMLNEKPFLDKDIADIYVRTSPNFTSEFTSTLAIFSILESIDGLSETGTDILIQALKIYKGRL